MVIMIIIVIMVIMVIMAIIMVIRVIIVTMVISILTCQSHISKVRFAPHRVTSVKSDRLATFSASCDAE